MIGVAWAFLSTKIGRYVAAAVAILAAVGAVLAKVYGAGKQAQRSADQKDQINAVEQAHEIHGDVSRLPPDAVDRELRQWSRR